MEEKLLELKTRLMEIDDLNRAAWILSWDQETYMPPGGAEARGRQAATLSRLAQEKFIDPIIGKLLDELQPYAESLPYDSDEASLIRVTRREYERMINVPAKFISEVSNHGTQTYQVWSEARPANDFARVRPLLEKTLDLSRQMTDFFPGYEHRVDPLVGFSDYGMKASTLTALFAELRQELVPIIQTITSQPPTDDSCLRKHYPQADQLTISKEIAARLGYDFQRGRMDLTHHPFETTFSVGDVRITTRVKENDLGECLYSVIHESGHAMYEQGGRPELEARRWAAALLLARMRVSRACGKTWSGAAAVSASFSFPGCRKSFPPS